jgi:hypothetical protein
VFVSVQDSTQLWSVKTDGTNLRLFVQSHDSLVAHLNVREDVAVDAASISKAREVLEATRAKSKPTNAHQRGRQRKKFLTQQQKLAQSCAPAWLTLQSKTS